MFRRAAVPSSAPRALHALSAPASTAAQNQQPKNLQKGCCTNYGIVSLLVGAGLWGLAELGWHDAWLVQGLFALGLLIRLVAHRRALRLPTVNSI